MAGGGKRNAWASGNSASCRLTFLKIARSFSSGLVPFVPWSERDEEKRVVGGIHGAEQAEADDGGRILDAGRTAEDLLDLLQTSSVRWSEDASRQLDVQIEVALVLHRQEAVREPGAEEAGGNRKQDQEQPSSVRLCGSSDRRSRRSRRSLDRTIG